jgi:hypothetical protein
MGNEPVMPLGCREVRNFGHEPRRRRRWHRNAACLVRRNTSQECPIAAERMELAKAFPIHIGNRDLRLAAAKTVLQSHDRVLGAQRADTDPGKPVMRFAADHAVAHPGSPADAQSRQSAPVAIVRQRIEKRIGGGVMRLSLRSPKCRDRGEADEEVEIEPLSHLMQQPSALHLGPQNTHAPRRAAWAAMSASGQTPGSDRRLPQHPR